MGYYLFSLLVQIVYSVCLNKVESWALKYFDTLLPGYASFFFYVYKLTVWSIGTGCVQYFLEQGRVLDAYILLQLHFQCPQTSLKTNWDFIIE